MREGSKSEKVLLIIGAVCLIVLMVLVFSHQPKAAREDCVARTTITYHGNR